MQVAPNKYSLAPAPRLFERRSLAKSGSDGVYHINARLIDRCSAENLRQSADRPGSFPIHVASRESKLRRHNVNWFAAHAVEFNDPALSVGGPSQHGQVFEWTWARTGASCSAGGRCAASANKGATTTFVRKRSGRCRFVRSCLTSLVGIIAENAGVRSAGRWSAWPPGPGRLFAWRRR